MEIVMISRVLGLRPPVNAMLVEKQDRIRHDYLGIRYVLRRRTMVESILGCCSFL